MSNETKLSTRGALPIGVMESMNEVKEKDERETMDKSWKLLANGVEEKNNAQLSGADDRRAAERLEKLRGFKDESHRLSNALSLEVIERLKKRRHKDFCCWERQATKEIKRMKKSGRRIKIAWIILYQGIAADDLAGKIIWSIHQKLPKMPTRFW